MNIKRSLIFLIFALAIYSFNVNSANINLGSCGTLSSGNTYTLTNNILNAPANCIWIHGNNIVFDGQGYTINVSSGNAVYFNAVYTGGVNYYNNTVKNLISNGNIGPNVWIPGDDYNLIHNITVENSKFKDAGFLGTKYLIVKNSKFEHLGISAAHDGPDDCSAAQTFVSPTHAQIINNTIYGGGEANFNYQPGGCTNIPVTNTLIENNTITNNNPSTGGGGGNIDVVTIKNGISYMTFRNNKIYSLYGPFGMAVRDGINNNLFENNYIWVNYTGYATIAIMSGSPVAGFNPPDGNVFRNNTLVGGQAMGIMIQGDATNHLFENNVFWGNAITTVTPTYAGGDANYLSTHLNNVFYHNTFISSNPAGGAAQLVRSGVNIGPTTFNNNIFVNTNSNQILDCNIFNPVTDYIGNNNIFYGTSTGTYCSYSGINAWKTATGEDANSLETNPLFAGTNPSPRSTDINEAYKFKLQLSSPACNIGGSYAGAYPCDGSIPSDTTPPVINNIRIVNTTNSSVIINWTTNEASSSLLKYGLTTSYGSQSTGNSNVIEHSVTITNLQSNTQYYYVVNSSDASGNSAQSSQQTFMTLATVQQCTINCTNYSLNLTAGLNFVSIPLVPSSNNINTLFNTIKPNMKAIFYYNSLNHDWEVYNANDSIPSDLLSIEPNKGYFIFMKNDSNLTITGSLTNSTGDTPIKQLTPGSGWNALGIFGLNSKTIAQELSGVNYTTFWKFNKTTNKYVQINSTSSLIYPGEAYWTYIN